MRSIDGKPLTWKSLMCRSRLLCGKIQSCFTGLQCVLFEVKCHCANYKWQVPTWGWRKYTSRPRKIRISASFKCISKYETMSMTDDWFHDVGNMYVMRVYIFITKSYSGCPFDIENSLFKFWNVDKIQKLRFIVFTFW